MEEHSDGHEGTDAEQDVEQLSELKQLEDSILAIIAKIKKDRNRACLQNIHTISRRGINIEAEKLRTVIENLIFRNVIVDKGREGKESFFVDVLSSGSDEILDNTKSHSEHEHNFNALHEFIDNRFYSTLFNKIKSEVKFE